MGGFVVLGDCHLLRVEADDLEGVAEVVDVVVAEELTFHDEFALFEFPRVVLLGGVLDRGSDAVLATLEARLKFVGVDNPGAQYVILLPLAKEGVSTNGEGKHNCSCDGYRVEFFLFCLLWHQRMIRLYT